MIPPIPDNVKRYLYGLAALCGAIVSTPMTYPSLHLPSLVLQIAAGILVVLAPFGIVSGGTSPQRSDQAREAQAVLLDNKVIPS